MSQAEKQEAKARSVIKACKCVHPYQDKKYGAGRRVHTVAKDGMERCTVCGPKARWQQRLESCAKMWLPVHGGK